MVALPGWRPGDRSYDLSRHVDGMCRYADADVLGWNGVGAVVSVVECVGEGDTRTQMEYELTPCECNEESDLMR